MFKHHTSLPPVACPLGTYNADGEVCAVKVIPREAVPVIDALVHEVDILRSLDHHQVMRYVDNCYEAEI